MRWVLWVLLVAAFVGGVLIGQRLFGGGALGPIEATPADTSTTVRVGETLTFAADAEGATAYSWSVWDHEVSREPVWAFVPGPEEVGWQQVTLVVTGPGDARRERAWNVAVVVPVAPEVTETNPPAGPVMAIAGTDIVFRCGARLPAARDVDRLHFEWTLDGASVSEEERPAVGGVSEVTITPESGVHRLAVYVREVDRIASFAEWVLDVAPQPEQMARVAPAGPAPRLVPPIQESPPPTPAAEITPPSTIAPPPPAAEVALVPTIPPPPPTIARRPVMPETPPSTIPPPPPPAEVALVPTIPPPAPTIVSPPVAPGPPPTIARRPVMPETPPSTIPPPLPAAEVALVPTIPPPAPTIVSQPVAPEPPPTIVSRAVALEPTPTTVPPSRLRRDPDRAEVAVRAGTGVSLYARLEPVMGATSYSWTVDGHVVQEAETNRFDYLPIDPGRHRIGVSARAGGRELGVGSWAVVARAPEPPAVVPPPPREMPHAAPGTTIVEAARRPVDAEAPPPPAVAPKLREDDVRRWLQDYASAWSRKDVETLRRMGQVRSDGEVDRLQRYFRSIDDLHVEVRVLTLHVDGDRAAVEFERVDTVTDPAGQRRELRLPPFRKEIERTAQGLRFAEVSGGHRGALSLSRP